MSIPELIRLLMAEGLDFDAAFELTRRVFSYTNHTVMTEALEKWDLELLRSVVPEVCEIIERIDAKLKQEHPHTTLFIVKDGQAHMANLSVYMSTAVNGVAEIHSQILKDDLFKDWYAVYPERFQNKTNGITPRRWLGLSNPELCGLLDSKVGAGYLKHLDQLEGLKAGIDEMTVKQFNAIKLEKKRQLCRVIEEHEGVALDPSFIFDVQVKRLHEYKRQLLNALSIMDLYLSIKDGSIKDFTPTAFIFGAKAAPGYRRAKAIIHYVNRVADLINSDPAMDGVMKVVFVQNYNCSYAEHIIPAADISEQISPAGTEASGTGNMKLMLNGAVTLGTLDGANVEIAEQAGSENEYIFGATVEEINMVKPNYNARSFYKANPNLRRAVDTLIDGTVPTDEEQHELYTSLLEGASWHKPDQYFLFYDFDSYKKARLRVNHDYCDRIAFGRKCLMNVASAGKFSSDRTICQYAEDIWHIQACKIKKQSAGPENRSCALRLYEGKRKMFDYLIQNGTLIDGTGAPAAAGDVAIKDGKIAAVGDLKDASAGTVLDAAGKYVTPGFIDIHRHADAALFRPHFGELELKQGLTTIVNGNCGLSVTPCGGSIPKRNRGIL